MRSFRFIIAIVIALVGLATYYGSKQENPITGESQRIALTPDQEVALGLEAAPQMAAQMGGLHPDATLQAYVNAAGQTIVEKSGAKSAPYQFRFHLLADPDTVNAFALPGGQIFITTALLKKLENEAQLMGVLGHEVGHVVGRHAAEHMAKGQLANVLAGAAGVAAADYRASAIANMVAEVTALRYGRNDELEADNLGLRFMSEAAYDPRALIKVMSILEQASGGRARGPEWLQSHPNPGNRRESIQQYISSKFPDGVPKNFQTGSAQRFAQMQARL